MARGWAVIVKGKNEFKKALYTDVIRADAAARNIVTEGAAIVADSAKEQFRARPSGSRTVAKSGRVYYKGAPQFPAMPPNPTVRTGNLRNSIRMRGSAKPLGSGRWMSITGPTPRYGGYVEYGTSRSRAFPYMSTGAKNAEERLAALAREQWAIAVGGAL